MTNKTVLVVEDEHPIRDVMMWALQRRDYDVLVTENAEEALPLVEKADLVLLNLRLPGMHGDQFIEKVRASGNFTPMIVVTATPLEDNMRAKLDQLKIVDWVSKPFSTADLMKRVEKALNVSEAITSLSGYAQRLKNFIARQETRAHRAAGLM
jgi:two-component system phosphate regulon response regulator PhoB